MKTSAQTWRERLATILLIPYAIAILAWGVIKGPRTREVDDD